MNYVVLAGRDEGHTRMNAPVRDRLGDDLRIEPREHVEDGDAIGQIRHVCPIRQHRMCGDAPKTVGVPLREGELLAQLLPSLVFEPLLRLDKQFALVHDAFEPLGPEVLDTREILVDQGDGCR